MKIFFLAWLLLGFLKNAGDLQAKLLLVELFGQITIIQEHLHIISMHTSIRKLWLVD